MDANGTLMPVRPVMRYHGGKWTLAPWIISHFPKHRVYTEVYGGAGSVLMRKPRSHSEVFNDLDGDVVNLFRVLRDRGPEIIRLLTFTPYAREEFDLTFERSGDAMEDARRMVMRATMGFGSTVTRPTTADRPMRTGFRNGSRQSGTSPGSDWRELPEKLLRVVDRLRGVVIENREAARLLQQLDAPDALHYVDPPYVHSTRGAHAGSSHCGYRHEMSDEDHENLAAVLNGLDGQVAISGYRSALYDRLYQRWRRVERRALADGGKERVEVLWMNYAGSADLFDSAGD